MRSRTTVNRSSEAESGLLERIAANDQAALGTLYDRHARMLFALILRVLRDRGDAEDVLQEVFVRVWKRADRYDPSLGSPVAWLVRIARNCAIDRVRARRVRPELADGPVSAETRLSAEADQAPSPEDRASRGESHRRVAAALATLPPGQRSLIECAFFEGLTHTELAERYRLPLGTVKTRIRSGMQALRARLSPEDAPRS